MVAIYEQGLQNGAGAVSLVAARPVLGTLVYRFGDGTPGKNNAEAWVCREHCTLKWTYDRAIERQSITFLPSDTGPATLLMQILVKRDGAYGVPPRRGL